MRRQVLSTGHADALGSHCIHDPNAPLRPTHSAGRQPVWRDQRAAVAGWRKAGGAVAARRAGARWVAERGWGGVGLVLDPFSMAGSGSPTPRQPDLPLPTAASPPHAHPRHPSQSTARAAAWTPKTASPFSTPPSGWQTRRSTAAMPSGWSVRRRWTRPAWRGRGRGAPAACPSPRPPMARPAARGRRTSGGLAVVGLGERRCNQQPCYAGCRQWC